MITAAKLRRFAPRIVDVAVHASALEAARLLSSVNSAPRLACFMGQVFVETAGFTCMVENLNYRSPERLDDLFLAVRGLADARALIARGPEAIANRVYASRFGNGDEASGDGWRFRGSGYKQLTFADNYEAMGKLVGMDLLTHPGLARIPASGARVAFAFWDAKSCSALADLDDVEGITERVNGKRKLMLAERRAATLAALEVWLT